MVSPTPLDSFMTVLLGCALSLSAVPALQAQVDENITASNLDSNTKVVAQMPYEVTARDGNQRIWSKTTWESNSLTGELTAKTNSFIEMATASSHLVNGQWVNSSDRVEITRTGAEAKGSQHKVEFLGNINSPGAIRITLPEGDKHLVSTPIGLSYFDTATGKSVMIAELKNSIGELLPSGNQVLYPDAFTGISADALYINNVYGFEQLIVLRQQPPSPSKWGLDPKTTVLQVITEFLNPPTPLITQREAEGLPDEHLEFGLIEMPRGFAFALGSETNTVVVTKQWLNLDGRQCLVESTPFHNLQPLLKELPAPAGQADFRNSPDSVLHKVASRHLLPSRKFASNQPAALQLAKVGPSAGGVAIDYTTLNTSQSNYVFKADTTYYISGAVTLSGTNNRFEGGTVIKFTNSASIINSGRTNIFDTSPYKPAIFTSKDDNSVGETITGSTGNPTNFTSSYYLEDATPIYRFLKMSYAGTAIYTENRDHEVWDCQFVRCQTGIYCVDSSTEIKLSNVLLANCGEVVAGGVTKVQGTHVTIDHCDSGGVAIPTTLAAFTNSLLTAVTNLSPAVNTNLVFYNCVTNSSSAGFYQTVGAGSYYLVDNSTNRNAGTTNIMASLLTDIRKRTTYPPLELSTNFSANTTLSPLVQRDTDTPDLGFHYDPLDYVATARVVTNVLTLTNGIAVGVYGSSSSYGFTLSGSGKLVSQGIPNGLNYIVRYNTVQEQTTTNWSASIAGPAVQITFGASANVQCRFTAWSTPAGVAAHFSTTTTAGSNSFTDCQFTGGKFSVNPGLVALTNCLWERTGITTRDNGDSNEWFLFNNLFRGGSLTYKAIGVSPVLLAYDNMFDAVSITKQSGSDSFSHDYNGYITGQNRLSPNGAHDTIVTNSPAYLASYLGNYYYPTNDGVLSLLINAGSRNATNTILYHYTCLTSQAKEASSIVDIGFHYVATDSSGVPIDTDDNGTPDYLADTNGNGFLDFGEFAFGITIENPANGTVVMK